MSTVSYGMACDAQKRRNESMQQLEASGISVRPVVDKGNVDCPYVLALEYAHARLLLVAFVIRDWISTTHVAVVGICVRNDEEELWLRNVKLEFWSVVSRQHFCACLRDGVGFQNVDKCGEPVA